MKAKLTMDFDKDLLPIVIGVVAFVVVVIILTIIVCCCVGRRRRVTQGNVVNVENGETSRSPLIDSFIGTSQAKKDENDPNVDQEYQQITETHADPKAHQSASLEPVPKPNFNSLPIQRVQSHDSILEERVNKSDIGPIMKSPSMLVHYDSDATIENESFHFDSENFVGVEDMSRKSCPPMMRMSSFTEDSTLSGVSQPALARPKSEKLKASPKSNKPEESPKSTKLEKSRRPKKPKKLDEKERTKQKRKQKNIEDEISVSQPLKKQCKTVSKPTQTSIKEDEVDKPSDPPRIQTSDHHTFHGKTIYYQCVFPEQQKVQYLPWPMMPKQQSQSPQEPLQMPMPSLPSPTSIKSSKTPKREDSYNSSTTLRIQTPKSISPSEPEETETSPQNSTVLVKSSPKKQLSVHSRKSVQKSATSQEGQSKPLAQGIPPKTSTPIDMPTPQISPIDKVATPVKTNANQTRTSNIPIAHELPEVQVTKPAKLGKQVPKKAPIEIQKTKIRQYKWYDNKPFSKRQNEEKVRTSAKNQSLIPKIPKFKPKKTTGNVKPFNISKQPISKGENKPKPEEQPRTRNKNQTRIPKIPKFEPKKTAGNVKPPLSKVGSKPKPKEEPHIRSVPLPAEFVPTLVPLIPLIGNNTNPSPSEHDENSNEQSIPQNSNVIQSLERSDEQNLNSDEENEEVEDSNEDDNDDESLVEDEEEDDNEQESENESSNENGDDEASKTVTENPDFVTESYRVSDHSDTVDEDDANDDSIPETIYESFETADEDVSVISSTSTAYTSSIDYSSMSYLTPTPTSITEESSSSATPTPSTTSAQSSTETSPTTSESY